MKFNKILFPTDFSRTGDAALHFATMLARESDAKLYLVHVQEPPAVYAGGEFYYGVAEPDSAALQAMLENLKPIDADVEHEHRLLQGDPATELVKFAKSEGIDLIVMGTHGRSGVLRMLMGSVAELVVRRAPCPVVTFHQTAEVLAER